MSKKKQAILSIAGFDPSAGAGVLSDIKTFESCDIYGMAAVSALTYQNDVAFEKVEWLSIHQITEQIEVLQKRFEFTSVKIGLIENLDTLLKCIDYLLANDTTTKIIWDPILKASAGYPFYKNDNQALLETICSKIYMITPNTEEAIELGTSTNEQQNAEYLSQFCHVYLKGGHNEKSIGTDILYTKDGEQIIYNPTTKDVTAKHGSGCVLSSAITANLAKGLNLSDACKNAKTYITDFLMSNSSLLGTHKREKELI